MGRLLDTFNYLVSALKITPRKPEYQILLADSFFQLGMIGGAIVTLESVLDINCEFHQARSFS